VAIIYDATQGMHDRYGRTLAYLVKGDGWNDAVEAARAGTAHAYIYDNSPVERYAEIAAAEQEARAAGPGCGDRRATARPHQCRSKNGPALRASLRTQHHQPRGRGLLTLHRE
jgi:endonuclease YncB( thermonuclease family)